ncbi:uncharacterized protein N7479_001772 [Penicillium vulpinum]|uniref:uncharacterized protein n=1 Tax=Penicillium vulpinum TaxID=29845 RepID=UPI002548C06F|nr:uncharacterized protein N7479_001772 [Penicillium vulpinum]KAJ5971854.1 hypothetical protein N7479_001772 [Penicillium vulpinum]
MASYSNRIIIPDDEESPSVEPGSSRPRRYPRRDYRYQEFENLLVEAIDDAPNMMPSRKRKRTETEPSSLVPVPHKTLLFLD